MRCSCSWIPLKLPNAVRNHITLVDAFSWESALKLRGASLAALKACSTLKSLELGRKIESDLLRASDPEDISLSNSLINMYTKCGKLAEARNIFDSMHSRDVISWNTLAFGYAAHGHPESALELFSAMEDNGGCIPNARSFLAALVACSSLAEKEDGRIVDGKLIRASCLERAMAIHSKAVSYRCGDIYISTALVSLFSRCGNVMEAGRVFHKMPEHNPVSWTCLIQGYAENEESELALRQFELMQSSGVEPEDQTYLAALVACSSLAAKEEGQEFAGKLVKTGALEKGRAIHRRIVNSLDVILGSALVNLYSKCRSLGEAREVFESMRHRDVVCWNTLILGYVENREFEPALQCFSQMMLQRCPPDGRTIVSALAACSGLAAGERGAEVDGKLVKLACLERAMWIHSETDAAELRDEFVNSSLVDMYSKCRSMEDAQRIFIRMATHDVVSWTALILGYAEAREPELALELFEWMKFEGCVPNALTFVAALVACGNSPTLESGRKVHGEINRVGLRENEIVGSSLVDFYGKCGSMASAEQTFISLEKRSVVTWSSLVAGYSREGNTFSVFDRFEQMVREGVRPNGITFLSVLTACSHAGLVEKGKGFFESMFPQFAVRPCIDHYHCMVDLFSRANRLREAVQLVEGMPFEADALTWNTILSGCCKWNNVETGKMAFECLLKLDDNQPAAYTLMANIFGVAGLWEDRARVLELWSLKSMNKLQF